MSILKIEMIYNYFSGGSNLFYLNLDNITFRTDIIFQLTEEISIIIVKRLDIQSLYNAAKDYSNLFIY